MKKSIVRRLIPTIQGELQSLHPVLSRIYSARHIQSLSELSKSLTDLLPYNLLTDIDIAVSRLIKALQSQQHIMIIGDFDADGATSTALAVSALQAFGAKHVSYLVPNRFTYGYGLTPEIVLVAKAENPDLIITVDNGISSLAGIETANELGIDVIVTDHHLQGKELPKAVAIVNPNRTGDHFQSRSLAGVGVIFYVMIALRAALKTIGWFAEQSIVCPNMVQFLDLVALGTIADVVPLDKNNRILVHHGLQQIRQGKARPGIQALLQVANRTADKINASDLGFVLGPRLNAAGRLDDMTIGISCLLAKDLQTALPLAETLDDLNKERRVIETQMQVEAIKLIDQVSLQAEMPSGICLYHPEWHQGVVGLIASRIKEKTHRPVIAFAKVDDVTLKGSARSIPGLHIRDVLENMALMHPELISKFGGHAMAAGLSLPITQYPTFQTIFATEVSQRLSPDDLRPVVMTDGELSSDHLNLELAEILKDAGPFGQGFPEPLFDGRFRLIDQRIVGNRHLKLSLQLPDSQYAIDAILFNVNMSEWPNHRCQQVHAAYRLDINDYQGHRKLQLIIETMDPV